MITSNLLFNVGEIYDDLAVRVKWEMRAERGRRVEFKTFMPKL